MGVVALMVYRGKPLGSLLAAWIGPWLMVLSYFGAFVLFFAAADDGVSWYVWPIATLFSLAALSYVLALFAIPPHKSPMQADAFTRRALVGSAIGIVVLAAAAYAWKLGEGFGSPPPTPMMIIAPGIAVILAVLATRRGGSKAVLITGGIIAFLFTIAMMSFSGTFTRLPVVWPVIGSLLTVPLMAAMARLAAVPNGERADGRVPAALIAASITAAPIITVLSFAGIDEARRIVRSDRVGLSFLEDAETGAWAYTVLFVVVVVGLIVLARRVWIRGGTAGTQAAVVTSGLAYLLLLTLAVSYTPFTIGNTDEAVPDVVIEGPVWYVPAVRAALLCVAAALTAASLLLMRRKSPPR
ncbi:hypothetical protein ACTWPT_08135 [Nonomuraea sp. 3N208]|uniref:hypothetical protein n=1 Tax=Nonomuraea sp. 3N208 TaxID=3457421 RepID=UPI003FCEB2F6